MSRSRFANLMMDTVSRLSVATTPEDRWRTVSDIAGALGANGVNAGEIDFATLQPKWASYNMETSWLREYADAGYQEFDPVLAGAMIGRVPRFLAAGQTLDGAPVDPRMRQFQAGLQRCGYNFFTSRGLHVDGGYRVLVLATQANPHDLYGPGTARALDCVTEILLGSLSQGTDPQFRSILGTTQGTLYAAERDILSLMAQGLTLVDVADRMRISLPKLILLLRQSCGKLGVATPDQAMATALTQGLLLL